MIDSHVEFDRTRTYADLLDSESIETINRSVDFISKNSHEIPEQMKAEMIAEIGASVLNLPIDAGEVMAATGIYRLLAGFEGFDQDDTRTCV